MQDIEIIYYIGLNNIYYNSLINYMIFGFTKIKVIVLKIKLFLNKSSQYIFNKKELVTQKRIDLLRILIDNYINRNGQSVKITYLMTKLYSLKWIFHPHREEQELKIKLLLDSFANSGELGHAPGSYGEYIVNAKAIATLSN